MHETLNPKFRAEWLWKTLIRSWNRMLWWLLDSKIVLTMYNVIDDRRKETRKVKKWWLQMPVGQGRLLCQVTWPSTPLGSGRIDNYNLLQTQTRSFIIQSKSFRTPAGRIWSMGEPGVEELRVKSRACHDQGKPFPEDLICVTCTLFTRQIWFLK